MDCGSASPEIYIYVSLVFYRQIDIWCFYLMIFHDITAKWKEEDAKKGWDVWLLFL